jgi:exopolyphosphatase / guanosine-5'-triphosphate,3'-diphosphate pyrophosphatase
MAAVAAIDIGSNAVRLLIAIPKARGNGYRTKFVRYALRLGTDAFAQGQISARTLSALVQVMKKARKQLRRYRVTRYRAVATAALREARNSPTVLRTVRRRTGVAIELIDGMEESRLMRHALLDKAGRIARTAILLDLGGGSLEITRARRENGYSLPLGTVRALHLFPQLATPLHPAQLKKARAQMKTWVHHACRGLRGARIAIGTGGSLSVLSELVPARRGGRPAILPQRLQRLIRAAAPLSVGERRTRYKLRRDRADLLLPAALTVEAVCARLSIEQLIVPGTGLREAILRELLETEGHASDFDACRSPCVD